MGTQPLHCVLGARCLRAYQPHPEDGTACRSANMTLLASLHPYASQYRNREAAMRRQAAEPHLEDGGIYRKRWWA